MKVVFISGMLPPGHYSQYLTSGFEKQENLDLIIYSDINHANLSIKSHIRIKLVWSRSIKYIYEIVRELRIDKPNIVHIQHEINMFGGIITAIFFPVLLGLLRISGYKVIVTIHGVVAKKQVNDGFINLFMERSLVVNSFFVKIFFGYLFRAIPFFSNAVIVHTNILKNILMSNYGISENKINVIQTAIPQKSVHAASKENYFFYFGYMVRRKGLGYVIEGFRRFIEANPSTNFKFVMAGGVIRGQEKALEEIKKIIKDNKLEERIILKGFVEEDELDALYSSATAVVIPAKISIAASGPLYHARSYGKCIIASKEGNFLEEIDDFESGILTENDKWNEAFEFIIKNPAIVEKIEMNSIKISKDRNPFETAKKHVDIYKKVVSFFEKNIK